VKFLKSITKRLIKSTLPSPALPFILLFQFGFLYTGALSVSQNIGKLGVVREQEA